MNFLMKQMIFQQINNLRNFGDKVEQTYLQRLSAMRGLGLNKPKPPIQPNNNRYKLNFKLNQIPKSCITDVSDSMGFENKNFKQKQYENYIKHWRRC